MEGTINDVKRARPRQARPNQLPTTPLVAQSLPTTTHPSTSQTFRALLASALSILSCMFQPFSSLWTPVINSSGLPKTQFFTTTTFFLM